MKQRILGITLSLLVAGLLFFSPESSTAGGGTTIQQTGVDIGIFPELNCDCPRVIRANCLCIYAE